MELYSNQIHCFDEIDLLTVDYIVNKNEKPIFNNLENIGYVFYGPLVFYFMVWLMNNLYQKEVDKIFFNSREGYFLLKLYNLMKTLTDSNDLPEGIYFKTSRRMATVPAIFNENDIYETLKLKGNKLSKVHRFEGTFKRLLYDRYGIKVGDVGNYGINLLYRLDTRKEQDFDRACEWLKKGYKQEIISNAIEERRNYLSYIDSICKKDDKIAMVDHGIHGTSQAYLEKIMNRKLIGNYFCITKNPNTYGLENVDSFYDYDTGHYKNFVTYFEAIFTAPEGTYIKCDKNGKFVNDKKWSNQLIFDKKISVFNGIKLFILDMIGDLLTVKGLKLNNKLPDFIFTLLESPDIIIENNIKKTFYFDNQYVTGKELLINKKAYPTMIGNGVSGVVVKLTDKYVVKLPQKYSNYTEENIRNEFKVAKFLYKNGVSVSKPKRVDQVDVRGKSELGFIMEYVKGHKDYIQKNDVDKFNFNEEDTKKAHGLAFDEFKKVIKLGVKFRFVGSEGVDNVHKLFEQIDWIYTDDEKVKLIDFVDYIHPEDLKNYKLIKDSYVFIPYEERN